MSGIETHSTTSPDALTPPTAAEAWQALVAPGDVLSHPREVLKHPTLATNVKRAILASWASDAHAVADAPHLRCLAGGRAEPVSLDAVLEALEALDEEPAPTARRPTRRAAPPDRRRPRLALLCRYVRRNGRDDDDDPPPCPAVIMPRPRSPQPAAAAVA